MSEAGDLARKFIRDSAPMDLLAGTVLAYERILRDEFGIDTDQPQEAIFAELRRRWDELVVAADPTVVAEGERC